MPFWRDARNQSGRWQWLSNGCFRDHLDSSKRCGSLTCVISKHGATCNLYTKSVLTSIYSRTRWLSDTPKNPNTPSLAEQHNFLCSHSISWLTLLHQAFAAVLSYFHASMKSSFSFLSFLDHPTYCATAYAEDIVRCFTQFWRRRWYKFTFRGIPVERNPRWLNGKLNANSRRYHCENWKEVQVARNDWITALLAWRNLARWCCLDRFIFWKHKERPSQISRGWNQARPTGNACGHSVFKFSPGVARIWTPREGDCSCLSSRSYSRLIWLGPIANEAYWQEYMSCGLQTMLTVP